MDSVIQISKLNDFLYSPKSLYFHSAIQDFDPEIFHDIFQKKGKDFDKHNDIWMAASCIQHNCTLITADEKDIGNKINGFKGFKYENWTKTD